jgi:hypothetical protein
LIGEVTENAGWPDHAGWLANSRRYNDVNNRTTKGQAMNKHIVQFHDGHMIRQRVMYSHLVASFFNNLRRCGIDMTTVISSSRYADDYEVGYLHFEYPLVGDRKNGLWD